MKNSRKDNNMEIKLFHDIERCFIQILLQDPDEKHDAPDELLIGALDDNLNPVEENFEVRITLVFYNTFMGRYF